MLKEHLSIGGIEINKIESTYLKVEEMAKSRGLEVKRFPEISNDVALVGNLILVWLSNLHWRNITTNGTSPADRDYGGAKSLENLFESIRLEKEAFERNRTSSYSITRFMRTEEYMKNKVREIILKK
ncbi:hypothetical protein IFU39_19050 [Paenibacillus sp. CFBP 13594]|uniref:hypothetical protein n=1 Tax=Paenibacillus sp. CFBP 13594 TaxID=2774037 RepID=UPI001780F54D|nr:hypothetical protein [Paenibacillus sp. CFBP 13594]MBD8839915.1 hypothetical protein [Paenibacillus sp. CFBP 13594]